jgi:hypothetical protein
MKRKTKPTDDVSPVGEVQTVAPIAEVAPLCPICGGSREGMASTEPCKVDGHQPEDS